MRNVIVTWFEPFGPYEFNPVQDTAKRFNQMIIGNISVQGIVLPCTYYGAFKKLKLAIDDYDPIAIVSMGLSSSVQRIRIETTSKNTMNGKYPDANWYLPRDVPIKEDADEFLEVNSNSPKVVDILKQEWIATEISTNADAFICNSLMYLTTSYIREFNLKIKNFFLHTPWTDDYNDKMVLEEGKISIPKEVLYQTVETIIKNMSEI